MSSITNEKFSDWEVIGQGSKKHKLKCKCSCGTIREVSIYDLKSGTSKSCGCNKHKNIDGLIGKHFSEWEVLGYTGKQKLNCKCSCGEVRDIDKQSLLTGRSKSCGHGRTKIDNTLDITNKQIGEWRVLRYCNNHKWICQCSCGNIREVSGYSLRSGKSNSCGHGNTLVDLTDRVFGKLKVKNYVGNGYWNCDCECGNTNIVKRGKELKNGYTKSCGCNTIHSIQMSKSPNRTEEQMKAVRSTQELLSFMGNESPTLQELSEKLGLSYSHTVKICNKLNVTSFMTTLRYDILQNELTELIKGILPEDKIITNDRKVLQGRELDIYIPTRRIAIEFNGSYWHSTLFKEERYHQQKTIDCAKQGIHLIHIFEYEWKDATLRQKIINYLFSILASNKVIYERQTTVKHIDYTEASKFCDKFHFQNSVYGEIYIGCYHETELLAVMIVGKQSSKSNKHSYELLRICFRPAITLVGGLEKMWVYLLDNHNINSLVTYIDITKFNGNSYTAIGFKPCRDEVMTEPGYVWVRPSTNHVVNCYQTNKSGLIIDSRSIMQNTEDEIMDNLGYLKIYNCGSIKLEWNKE